jgi:serine protease AprX
MALGSTSSTPAQSVYVSPSLAQAAQQQPSARFEVIVKGREGEALTKLTTAVRLYLARYPDRNAKLERTFQLLGGVEATLTGRQIAFLQKLPFLVESITRDAPLPAPQVGNGIDETAKAIATGELWHRVAGVDELARVDAPAIAVVDSGIDAQKKDFKGRVLAEVNLYRGSGKNSSGDGRGHGTMVASVAAGDGKAVGAAPGAKLVSIDVLDDEGKGTTADMIAAAEWILKNRDAYDIRVANFSLHGTSESSFMFDPLNKAVEALWHSGVVVVTAAGNYGRPGMAVGVPVAPANDPFVITVGAADTNGTLDASDDFAGEWSAYGYTLDGFAKPELGAPGRYMKAAIPVGATMLAQLPERRVDDDDDDGDDEDDRSMWMSGTSFAAPVVAGAAAQILAVHPEWSADQVKGALMLTAKPTAARNGELGVGMIDAAAAAAVADPPNPNAALNRFLVAASDGSSAPTFDAASWASAAKADASWASASWASASWASASWASASWASASWASASWASASWASASWASASWASASWASASWASASWAAASWVS